MWIGTRNPQRKLAVTSVYAQDQFLHSVIAMMLEKLVTLNVKDVFAHAPFLHPVVART